MQYDVVPQQDQDAIRSPRRAAWFVAMLDEGMLKMSSRPTLSQAQKDVLEAQGMRFRSRSIDGAMYVWVEDIPSSDLNETAPLDDDEVPL